MWIFYFLSVEDRSGFHLPVSEADADVCWRCLSCLKLMNFPAEIRCWIGTLG